MVTLHEFPCGIYPRRLWVIFTDDTKQLRNTFNTEVDFEQDVDKCEAFVFPCSHKESGNIGVCVVFRKHKYATVKNIAHESVHVASVIFADCNMTMGFSDGKDEHFAYLVGWAADCINQVKTGKFKD